MEAAVPSSSEGLNEEQTRNLRKLEVIQATLSSHAELSQSSDSETLRTSLRISSEQLVPELNKLNGRIQVVHHALANISRLEELRDQIVAVEQQEQRITADLAGVLSRQNREVANFELDYEAAKENNNAAVGIAKNSKGTAQQAFDAAQVELQAAHEEVERLEKQDKQVDLQALSSLRELKCTHRGEAQTLQAKLAVTNHDIARKREELLSLVLPSVSPTPLDVINASVENGSGHHTGDEHIPTPVTPSPGPAVEGNVDFASGGQQSINLRSRSCASDSTISNQPSHAAHFSINSSETAPDAEITTSFMNVAPSVAKGKGGAALSLNSRPPHNSSHHHRVMSRAGEPVQPRAKRAAQATLEPAHHASAAHSACNTSDYSEQETFVAAPRKATGKDATDCRRQYEKLRKSQQGPRSSAKHNLTKISDTPKTSSNKKKVRATDAEAGATPLYGQEVHECSLSAQYPTVVYVTSTGLDSQWCELKCFVCQSNCSVGNFSYFAGIRGVMQHLNASHKNTSISRASALERCISQRLAVEDVQLLLDGKVTLIANPITITMGNEQRRYLELNEDHGLLGEFDLDGVGISAEFDDSMVQERAHEVQDSSVTELVSSDDEGTQISRPKPSAQAAIQAQSSVRPESLELGLVTGAKTVIERHDLVTEPSAAITHEGDSDGALHSRPGHPSDVSTRQEALCVATIRIPSGRMGDVYPQDPVDMPSPVDRTMAKVLGRTFSDRNSFKAVHSPGILHENFPASLCLEGEWYFIACNKCKANAIQDHAGLRPFMGLGDLAEHVRKIHGGVTKFKDMALWCSLDGPIESADAAAMKETGLSQKYVVEHTLGCSAADTSLEISTTAARSPTSERPQPILTIDTGATPTPDLKSARPDALLSMPRATVRGDATHVGQDRGRQAGKHNRDIHPSINEMFRPRRHSSGDSPPTKKSRKHSRLERRRSDAWR